MKIYNAEINEFVAAIGTEITFFIWNMGHGIKSINTINVS